MAGLKEPVSADSLISARREAGLTADRSSLAIAGDIPDMRLMSSFSLRVTPSLLIKSSIEAVLNGVLSCSGGYT